MSGWLSACRKHRDEMIKDIEESEYFFNGMCPAENNINCDYPGCETKGRFEVYWGEKSLRKSAEESKVSIGSLVDASLIWEGDI